MSDPRNEWQVVHREDYPTPALTDFVRASHGGGRWVAVGRAAVGGGTTANRGLVATATAADGPWSSQVVTGATGLNDVAYADGIWTAVGRDSGGVIFTATSPSGTWTQQTMPTEGTSALELQAVTTDGSIWAAIGRDGRIYTATDPTDTWAVNTAVKANAETVYAGGRPSAYIAYVDGTWVAALANTLTTSSSTWSVRIYSADAPDGAWTHRDSFAPGFDTSNQRVNNIFFTDGFWFVSKTQQLWAADALDGAWSLVDVSVPPSYVSFADGDFVIAADQSLFVAAAPDGILELADVEAGETGSAADIRSTAYDGDDWLGVGFVDRSDATFGSGQGLIWTPGGGGDGWGIVL